MKNAKLIITVAVILGVSVITSQAIKQNSDKEQVKLKIAQERRVFEYEKDQKSAEKSTKILAKMDLNNCLESAEEQYWNYMELNGTGDRVEGVEANTYIWDAATDKKKDDIDNCYKRYQVND